MKNIRNLLFFFVLISVPMSSYNTKPHIPTLAITTVTSFVIPLCFKDRYWCGQILAMYASPIMAGFMADKSTKGTGVVSDAATIDFALGTLLYVIAACINNNGQKSLLTCIPLAFLFGLAPHAAGFLTYIFVKAL